MFKKTLLAGIAVGVVALGAPAASADHVRSGCGVITSDAPLIMYAWVAGYPGDAVSIDCYLMIGTTTGPGISASGTTYAGSVQGLAVQAGEGEVVKVCYTATAGGHTVTNEPGCTAADSEIPPPVVWELLDRIISGHVDPTLCSALAAARGSYGDFGVDSEGDVFFDFDADGTYEEDEWLWDCYKYHYTGEDQPDGSFDH